LARPQKVARPVGATFEMALAQNHDT
jgi:hypothetical protein